MIPTTRVAVLVSTAVLGLTALTACSSSTSPNESSATSDSSPTHSSDTASAASSPAAPDSTGAPSEKAATITIKDFAYSGTTKVPAGAQITVKNDDSEAHTVTSDTDGAFDVTIAPGKSATFAAPAKAGSYPYHCTYHGNMHGNLDVG